MNRALSTRAPAGLVAAAFVFTMVATEAAYAIGFDLQGFGVPGFSGHADVCATASCPAGADQVDGTINFAVFSPLLFTNELAVPFVTDLSSRFAPGIGSPSLATAAGQYLYLFQPTNDGPGTAAILEHRNNLGSASAAISSWGSFPGLVFEFFGAHFIGASGNTPPVACSTLAGGCVDSPIDPVDLLGTPTGLRSEIVDIVPLVAPVSLSGASIVAPYRANTFTSGSVGTLIGFTSWMAPGVLFGSLGADGQLAIGATPGPAVPEPASLALLALGLAALTLSRVRFKL